MRKEGDEMQSDEELQECEKIRANSARMFPPTQASTRARDGGVTLMATNTWQGTLCALAKALPSELPSLP